MTQLFKRFQAHFGFEVTFCNPDSGHEKGNVENKVGYARRNYLVPVPSVTSLQEWNTELLQCCDFDNLREHYKKGTPICDLFAADRQAMLPLPRLPFEACRYEHVKTNGYGKFVLDGRHTYSSAPMYANREIAVRIGAHFIEPLDAAGDAISRHERAFGSERTDTVDWLTLVDQLMVKPGAWRNSPLRSQMSYEVRDYMDEQDRSGLRQALRRGTLALRTPRNLRRGLPARESAVFRTGMRVNRPDRRSIVRRRTAQGRLACPAIAAEMRRRASN